jgi:4-diphosphocytidyl-2-C-methyl-D-erythritol kinase
MLVFPNAKINIGLNITGKRPDGYHSLESVFYPVGLSDVLEITRQSASWSMSITGLKVDGDPQKNLCIKAARLFQERFGIPSSTIYLHKIIPMGAGLGGGSSDAAYTLKCLNAINGLPASDDQVFEMAMQIGSDCGFFIKGAPAYVEGRGEVVNSMGLDLSAYEIALVHPGIHVGTAEAYSMITPKKSENDLKNAVLKDVSAWKDLIKNDFEEPMIKKFPAIGGVKERLYEMGALYASMSGSGSAVYGIFKKVPEGLQEQFKDYFVWAGRL